MHLTKALNSDGIVIKSHKFYRGFYFNCSCFKWKLTDIIVKLNDEFLHNSEIEGRIYMISHEIFKNSNSLLSIQRNIFMPVFATAPLYSLAPSSEQVDLDRVCQTNFVQKIDRKNHDRRRQKAPPPNVMINFHVRASVWVAGRNLHLRRGIQLSPFIVTLRALVWTHYDDNPLRGQQAVSCGLPAPERIMPSDNLIMGWVDAALCIVTTPIQINRHRGRLHVVRIINAHPARKRCGCGKTNKRIWPSKRQTSGGGASGLNWREIHYAFDFCCHWNEMGAPFVALLPKRYIFSKFFLKSVNIVVWFIEHTNIWIRQSWETQLWLIGTGLRIYEHWIKWQLRNARFVNF